MLPFITWPKSVRKSEEQHPYIVNCNKRDRIFFDAELCDTVIRERKRMERNS